MLKGKHIIVGVTGSIAAYKTAILVRALVKEGAEVKVIMTSQRVRAAESRAENEPSNGPRRAQSNPSGEYSATRGTRQLPGI